MLLGARWTPRAAAAALAMLLTAAGSPAAAAPVTLAWDPSPDASAVGYRVYVGTASGQYTESFDVGALTSFTYNGSEGTRYYFAVAAYATGPVVGPLSQEVWATIGVASTAPGGSGPLPSGPVQGGTPAPGAAPGTIPGAAPGTIPGDPLGPIPSEAPASAPGEAPPGYWSWVWLLDPSPSGGASCALHTADCAAVQTIAHSTEVITSLAAAEDGRVFFVEGGRRIRVATPSGVAAEAVLVEQNASIVLHQVAVDPAFTANGFLWISGTETRRDGSKRLTITRYRVAGNLAGERTDAIPAIPMLGPGQALFTIDRAGSIYVALPGSRQRFAATPGRVLRFKAPDVAAPAESRAAEILAHSYTTPTAIAVDGSAGRLWLSGSNGPQSQGTSSLAIDGAGAGGPALRESRSALSPLHLLDGKYLFSVTAEGRLERAKLAVDALVERQPLSLGMAGPIRTIAPGTDGQLYAAVQLGGAPGSNAFTIVRILPAP